MINYGHHLLQAIWWAVISISFIGAIVFLPFDSEMYKFFLRLAVSTWLLWILFFKVCMPF